MANNLQPHISQNVFLNQSHTTIKQQQNLGVRQDKRADFSARIASSQPASLKRVMRAQQLKKDTPRSQNKPTPKRKTVQLTLWVKPIVLAELKRIAVSEGLSVSAT